MIQILVDNQSVYLGNSFQVRLDLIFPAFEHEFDYSSIIYPFDIPAPANERLFNFSNHIIINRKQRLYDCQVIFFGFLSLSAKLVLTKLNRQHFRGSIIVNRFSTEYKEKLLSEFDYDGDISLGATTDYVINHVDGKVLDETPGPHLKYNFPERKAPEFYGDENESNPAFCGILNRWDRANQSIQPNYIQTSLEQQNSESLLPCPYLFYVIEKCLNECGYRAVGSLLQDEDLMSLLILNNYPLDLVEKLYYVRANNSDYQLINPEGYINADDDFTPPNEDAHDIWNQDVSDADPAWRYHIQTKGYHEVSMQFKARYGGAHANAVVRVSMEKNNDGNPITLYYHDLDLTYEQTWYEFTVNFSHYFQAADEGDTFSFYAKFYDRVTLDDINGQFQCLDLIIMNISAGSLNSFAKTLHISNHVPAITLGNLFNAIKKGFGAVIFFSADHKQIQFSSFREIINSSSHLDLSDNYIAESEEIELNESEGLKLNFEFDGNDPVTQDNFTDHSNYELIGFYETFHHLPTPDRLNVVAIVLNTNTVYFYGIIDEDAVGWSVFSDNYYDYIYGGGDKDEKIPFSPVMMELDREDNLASTTIRPITLLTASSPAFGTGRNDFGFQLLFFRGMYSDGALYPLGSSVAYGPAGDDIANVELQLPGEKGLVENYLKPWLEYIAGAETVKMDFDISPDRLYDIIQLFSVQHGQQKRKVLINGISFLPKKFSLILSPGGIEKCEGMLVKKGEIAL
jgi:hypothetical protein